MSAVPNGNLSRTKLEKPWNYLNWKRPLGSSSATMSPSATSTLIQCPRMLQFLGTGEKSPWIENSSSTPQKNHNPGAPEGSPCGMLHPCCRRQSKSWEYTLQVSIPAAGAPLWRRFGKAGIWGWTPRVEDSLGRCWWKIFLAVRRSLEQPQEC